MRDSDRILGIIQAKSWRAENGQTPVKEHLLMTRYCPKRVSDGEMLSIKDVQDILEIPLLGVIPEAKEVLLASNAGTPIILYPDCDAATAYSDAVSRILGQEMPVRFTSAVKKGFINKLLGWATCL